MPTRKKRSDWLSRSQSSDQTGRAPSNLIEIVHGAINYLTNIFYLSISTGQIREIWHKSIIITILIPSKNWRPISLLRPAANILEKLLLPKILTHILFHHAEDGYRPKIHCTVDDLLNIAAGFSRKYPAHR